MRAQRVPYAHLVARIVPVVLKFHSRFRGDACPSPARGHGRFLEGTASFGTEQTCLLFVVGPGRISGPGGARFLPVKAGLAKDRDVKHKGTSAAKNVTVFSHELQGSSE